METMIAVTMIELAAVTAIVMWAHMRRRTARLQRQFGPEYDRLLAETGSRRRTEAEIEARLKRVKDLHIRELDAGRRMQLVEAWRSAQTRFADDARGAVVTADRLVEEALEARGYPVGDFDQCLADISVHHAYVAGDYRSARDITSRAGQGRGTKEDLRQAMIFFRALFEDVLGERVGPGASHHERAA